MPDVLDFSSKAEQVAEPLDFSAQAEQLDFSSQAIEPSSMDSADAPTTGTQKRAALVKEMEAERRKGQLAESFGHVVGAAEATAKAITNPIEFVKQTERGIEAAATLITGSPKELTVKPSEIMQRPLAPIPPAQPRDPDSKIDKVAAGVANAVIGFANFMQTPEGAAMLGIGALPEAVRRGITAAIAGQMATHAPESFKAAVEAVVKGDIQAVAQHTTEFLGGTAMSALAGQHAVKKPGIVEKLVAADAPLTAEAVKGSMVKDEVPIVDLEKAPVVPAESVGLPPVPKVEPAKPAEPVVQTESAKPIVEAPTALVGMGGATPAEFALNPKTPTGIKNATVDQERATRGLQSAMQPTRRSFGTVWDQAMAKIDQDPGYPDRLLAELRDKPRSLTDVEDATVLHRQIDLQNEYGKATRDLAQAFDDGRLDDVADQKVRVAGLSDQLLDLYNIGKAAGTETGRGLAARKMMAYEDFSLAKMELEKRAAKGGEQLTDAERTEVTELNRKIEATQKAYDDYVARTEERLRQAGMESAYQEVTQPEPASARRARGAAPETQADLTGKLKERFASNEMDVVTPLVQRLARLFVEQGIKERDPLIDAVHGVLKEIDPAITRRKTMDAISGYGDFKQLTKDEISVKLRDLKGQMQQVAKLEDIQERKPPLKTGVERRAPSDEERRLIKLVNEAKRRFGIVVTDPATQLKSALEARKTYYRNQIADLESQIAAKEKFIKEKADSPTDPELEALKAKSKELRTEFENIFGKPGLSDAQRLEAMGKHIATLEAKIATGDISKAPTKANRPLPPELERARQRIEALNQQLAELRESAKPKKSAEYIALQTLKTRLKTSIAKMEDQLKRGDFAKRVPVKPVLDTEAQKLSYEAAKLKVRWHEGLMKDRLARRTLPQKLLGGVGEVLNTTRAILTSLDLSAVLRQGGFISFGHPIRAVKAFPAMFRALKSEAGQHAVNQEIIARKNYPLYLQSKLYLAEHGQRLSHMEETYMSRWADKIPLVAGSQRAYVTFLNKLRADSFDAMVNTLSRDGTVTPVEAGAIANFINAATGRGKVGFTDNAAVGLSTVFFAPRYVASRFQLIAGQPLYRGTTRTRKLVATEYARFLMGVGVVYGLAKLTGGDVETDPRSSDFGKVRFDNTRIDPMAGLLQPTVLLSRLSSGETKRLTGAVVPIRGRGVPFGGDDAADVTARFLRTKLSPVIGTGINVMSGTDVTGKPVTPESAAENLLVPLALQDIYKTMVEQGVPTGTAMALLSIFGMGLQTYDNR